MTGCFAVRMAMQEGHWFTPYEVKGIIMHRYEKQMSDASITARMRDLRKQRFGGYTIDRRQREGTRSFEYKRTRPTPQTELEV